MVDLTKSINNAQTAITKIASKTPAPKAQEAVLDSAEKIAEDIRKIDVIGEIAKAQANANIPDYVYNIAKKLNRQ